MKSVAASPWVALVLKLVGGLLLLMSLIDYLTLLSTAKFQDNQWVVTFTTQVVDRGFIPLVAITLLFVGYWIESASGTADDRNSPALRLAALVLASVLGVFFLAVGPWNVLSTGKAAESQVSQINDEAKKATEQLNAQAQQLKGQGAQQLDAQLAQVEQFINSGQVSGAQLDQLKSDRERLKKLKADPKALEAEIDSRIGPQRAEEQKKIDNRKKELIDQTNGTAMRSGLRTGLNSLLLAIGYIFIGWTGLRQLRF
jgi:hypothetical protein